MSYYKLFQLSCPVFWGFNRQLQIKLLNDNMNTDLELVTIDNYNIDTQFNLDYYKELILNELETFLFQNNLIDLLEYFKNIRNDYHIHMDTLEHSNKCSDNLNNTCQCHDNNSQNKNNFINLLKNNNIIYVCRHPNNKDTILQ